MSFFFIVFYALYSINCFFYYNSIHCILLKAVYAMLYALYSMYCILCTVSMPLHFILCTEFYALFALHCILQIPYIGGHPD